MKRYGKKMLNVQNTWKTLKHTTKKRLFVLLRTPPPHPKICMMMGRHKLHVLGKTQMYERTNVVHKQTWRGWDHGNSLHILSFIDAAKLENEI